MLRKLRLVTVVALTICVLAPGAFSAPMKLGAIVLYESAFEKFGELHYPFMFQMPPTDFVLCELGIDPTTGQCVNKIVSDVVCVTNNNAGEGTVAMISDLENGLSLDNLPPDFPCSTPNSVLVFLKETGKAQTLSGKTGFPTVLPGGSAGPFIKVVATSDLDPSPTTTSDSVVVSTM